MLALHSRVVLLAVALCALGSLAAVPAAASAPDDAPWQLASTSRRAAEASPLTEGALLPRSVARAKFSLRDEPVGGRLATIARALEPAARVRAPRRASLRTAPENGRATHLRIGVLLI
jgi:hypothetical protein